MRSFLLPLLSLVIALHASSAYGLAPQLNAKRAVDAATLLSNGQQAQQMNSQFASFTANSPCTNNQQACVQGSFAQCMGGKFAMTACAGGTQCFALPLVNKAGTSITCDTAQDAQARIAATGATGGTGVASSGSSAGVGAASSASAAAAPAAASSAAQPANSGAASTGSSGSCAGSN